MEEGVQICTCAAKILLFLMNFAGCSYREVVTSCTKLLKLSYCEESSVLRIEYSRHPEHLSY